MPKVVYEFVAKGAEQVMGYAFSLRRVPTATENRISALEERVKYLSQRLANKADVHKSNGNCIAHDQPYCGPCSKMTSKES